MTTYIDLCIERTCFGVCNSDSARCYQSCQLYTANCGANTHSL